MLGTLPPQSDIPSKRRGGRSLFVFLLLIAVFAGGVFVGKQYFGGGSGLFIGQSQSGLNFALYDEVYSLIKRQFVEPPKDNSQLEYGSIRGLVAGLGDPNSNFMDPEETKAFQENLDGRFSGIGVELAIKNEVLTVVAPLPESPGEKEGLKAGDIILAIEDADTSTLTLDQAVQKIRGESGTQVRLLITRTGAFEAKEFKITRQEINIVSVKHQVRDDNVGVLEITRFGEDTAAKVNEAASDFLSKNVKGIVLDLRGNPGGFLESAVDIAGVFLEDGVIVSEEFGDGSKQEYRAQGEAQLRDIPLVVLVDEGSASAAEILAGALQDYGRAKLVGAKTFGKGSVQELSSLSQGTSLRLTVAKFVLPKGRKIDHVGIEPDIAVKISAEDLDAGKDPQLDKALELL